MSNNQQKTYDAKPQTSLQDSHSHTLKKSQSRESGKKNAASSSRIVLKIPHRRQNGSDPTKAVSAEKDSKVTLTHNDPGAEKKASTPLDLDSPASPSAHKRQKHTAAEDTSSLGRSPTHSRETPTRYGLSPSRGHLDPSTSQSSKRFPSLSHRLPTFVPASIFGSDSSLSSPSEEDSDSNSSSSDNSDAASDVDSEIAAEERMIVEEEESLATKRLRSRMEKKKLDREGHNDPPEAGKRWDEMNWDRREPSGFEVHESSFEDDSSSDESSANDEDEDADDDDDAEPGDAHSTDASRILDLDSWFSAPGVSWSEDEEEGDAALFFANLSDTDEEATPNDEDGSDLRSALVVGHIDGDQTGDLAFAIPVDGSQWDAQHIFPGSRLGLPFEDPSSTMPEKSEKVDASMKEISEDYESSECPDDEDEGDTTDEDELHPELGPIVFGNSSFVNPSSTLHDALRRKVKAAKASRLHLLSRASRNLSRVRSQHSSPSISRDAAADKKHVRQPRRGTPTSSSGSQVSESGRLLPMMGPFSFNEDGAHTTAVIEAARDMLLPSPFPRADIIKEMKRKRRKPAPPSTPTPSPGSIYTQLQELVGTPDPCTPSMTVEGLPARPSSPEASEMGFIDLDQLLNLGDHVASDDEEADVLVPLGRWSVVPIDAFRRRHRSGVSESLPMSPMYSAQNVSSPRPSDGFSYGSATPRGVFSTGAFDSSLGSPSFSLSSDSLRQKRGKKGSSTPRHQSRAAPASLVISPVLIPVQSSDTDQRRSHGYLTFSAPSLDVSESIDRDESDLTSPSLLAIPTPLSL